MNVFSSFNDEQEDEELRCYKCLCYFSSFTKPYLLPCNKHNLCMNCIEELIKEKKKFCPICKISFSIKDKENFKVNLAFLNLISKILKSKIILCQKCNQIFYWKDHYDKCEQKYFTEVNKIIKEIKKLCEECFTIISEYNHHKNILSLSKSTIYDCIQFTFNKINQKFIDNYSRFINNLFSHTKKINIEFSKKEIIKFLEMIKENHQLFNNLNFDELNNLLLKYSINNFQTVKKNNPLFSLDSKLKKSKSPFTSRNNKNIYFNTSKKKIYNNNDYINNNNHKSDDSDKTITDDENDVANEGIHNLKIRQIKLNKNIEYNLPVWNDNKNNVIFDMKEILDDITFEQKPKNKIIVGLNGIKVISSSSNDKYKNHENLNSDLLLTERKNRNLEIINKNNVLNTQRENKINKISIEKNINNSVIVNSNNNKKENNEIQIINKMIKNFNKLKDITNQMREYLNNYSDKNKILLEQMNFTTEIINPKIISDYNLLLSEISYNYHQSYKKYLLSYVENSTIISLFDISSNKFLNKDIKDIIKETIIDESISIVFDDFDLLFITGGNDNKKNTPSNLFICVRWSSMKIEINDKIPLKRYYHSSIIFDNKLYIIGGLNENKNLINECHSYNLIKKKWEKIPNLKQPRIKPTLCIYNNNYLFVIKGKDNNSCLDNIEFLNIKNISEGWILFKPKDPGLSWINCDTSCAITIDKNKILIFGGRDFNNELNQFSFILDIENQIIYKGKDISFCANFIFEPTILQNNIFAIDWKNNTKRNKGNCMHIYDFKKKKWFYEYI